MSVPTYALIDSLVADLVPVRRARARDGLLIFASLAVLAMVVVARWLGLRADLAAGDPALMVVVRSAALALIASATISAVVAAARPAVGERATGWMWALAAAALLPAASLFLALRDGVNPNAVFANSVYWCFGVSLSAAIMMSAVMVMWLRQGAVTEPLRAGTLTGLASAAAGAFAYNLHCPSSSIHYAALWYGSVLVVGALAGRAILPRFLRW
ncbi:MAG: NrsF family protein [Erythrobacter sp.]